MNKQFKQVLADVVVLTAWITFIGTLAYASIGESPQQNTSYEWWIVPLMLAFAGAPIHWGWKLRKHFDEYERKDAER